MIIDTFLQNSILKNETTVEQKCEDKNEDTVLSKCAEKNEDTVDQSKIDVKLLPALTVCQGVAKNPESEGKEGQNPSFKFEKLAPIFLFNSKGKKQVELLGEKRKKVRKKPENIQKLPKIYKYFSVKQDLGENEPNQAQLYPTKTPPITTTMDRYRTEDKGGGD